MSALSPTYTDIMQYMALKRTGLYLEETTVANMISLPTSDGFYCTVMVIALGWRRLRTNIIVTISYPAYPRKLTTSNDDFITFVEEWGQNHSDAQVVVLQLVQCKYDPTALTESFALSVGA